LIGQTEFNSLLLGYHHRLVQASKIVQFMTE